MDLCVMNKSLETIAVIDTYESIIWTKRYFSAGDFELYLPATSGLCGVLSKGNYIYRLDDDAVMIIENISISTDAELGNHLTVSGRSVESILRRRIVWNQTTFNSNFETVIRTLLNISAISPSDTSRIIPNLALGEAKGYDDKLQIQFTGDNLYDVIVNQCTNFGIGWKITFKEGKLVFDLYKGLDRSYNQTENPYVIFSPEFDNLINSNYQYDSTNFANVALVAGEGEGVNRKKQSVGNASGLDRYEIFVDAKDLSSNTNEPISDEEYNQILIERGNEQLVEYRATEAFEGEVDTERTYVYARDWNLGDIVQIENEYGITATSRIIEIIENEDASGHKIVPTFTTWEV